MHVSLYQRCDLSLLGHADLSKPTPVWNTLSICPTTLTNSETTGEKLLSVVGNDNGLSFTVQIAEGASEIALDQPHTVNVQGDEVSVFQFISPQGISDKQLDITATSQSNVAAYLKVSQNCKEVDVQKDLKSNKKESLRLSFATKGRITLSSVSIPPLTDSVSKWFIVIGLKNLSGDVKRSESKSVTLKLTRSFDYSYTTPIFVLLFVSFVVGILVSIVAYYLFEKSLTQVKPGRGVCNLNLRITYRDLLEVIIDHWFSFGPKTYSYITGIVGAMHMVPVFQFAFENWYTMIQEGDRDNCYYNDFCYKVAYHDIPFNLMISNLPYIVHSLILVVWVLMVEAKVNLRRKSGRTTEEAEEIKNWYSFSIGYAFSWALFFQGLFSTLYHVCPNRSTFQFDTAFMYVIAGLTVLLLYNGIDQSNYITPENVKYQIGAGKFFLIFTMSLFYFNYFDVLFNSYGLNTVMQRLFLLLWWVIMFHWAFRELGIWQKICSSNFEDNLMALVFIILVLLPTPFLIYLFDLAQAFLWVCISWSLIAIAIRFFEKLLSFKSEELYVEDTVKLFFGVLTVIIWVIAVWVFKQRPTTDKTSSPENSRDQNKECAILEFFDCHDLWHFLSSFALFMGAFVIMFLSSTTGRKDITGLNASKIRTRSRNSCI